MKRTLRPDARRFILHPSSFIPFVLLALSCHSESARTMRDDIGRAVAVPAHPARVISLAPNITEIIYAIDGQGVLIATDDNSDFPPAAKKLPKVGGMQPNIEKITSLKPDLVIASTEGNQPNLAPALAAVNIPLFVLKTDHVNEIGPAMVRVGGLTGASRASRAAATVEQQIAKQRRRRARVPRVLFAVWADPIYAAGVGSFIDDVLHLTGAANAVQLKGWPQYPLEKLIASPPDLILYPGKTVPKQQIERLFQSRPELLKKIALVPVDDNLFTRPGPRIAEAARALNGILDRWAASF